MSQKELTPAQRVIVIADMFPEAFTSGALREHVFRVAGELHHIGVYLYLSTALRVCGYDLIDKLHRFKFGVVAGLNFYDTRERLLVDAQTLQVSRPDIVTVACATGAESIRAFTVMLRETCEVSGIADSRTDDPFSQVWEAALSSAFVPASWIRRVRYRFRPDFIINATEVPTGQAGDAIKAGATRVVIEMPRGITYSRDAVTLVIRDIERALEEMKSPAVS